MYGPFTNEQLVGEALQPFKGHVIIATKFGWKAAADGKWSELGSRPENIKRVAEASLKTAPVAGSGRGQSGPLAKPQREARINN
ncbi:hypothetical protein GCM10028803_45780 [Larkinella knui]|uniref:Aldo/keto reductase n=1 Tax=Larkinella knui TaxID=2025310 RepID=A0A3P1CPB8_9BACT|nr:aldo/keto reductase [Larkinella knui]